jgi:hypothetical protein
LRLRIGRYSNDARKGSRLYWLGTMDRKMRVGGVKEQTALKKRRREGEVLLLDAKVSDNELLITQYLKCHLIKCMQFNKLFLKQGKRENGSDSLSREW